MNGNIQSAWCEETAFCGMWNPKNRAAGQCAVTALLVQDYLGGEIVRADVIDNATGFQGRHYWNVVGPADIDLTRSQFSAPVFQNLEVINRRQLLWNDDTRGRYLILKDLCK